MVLCKFGASCIDQSSQPAFNCFGCNSPFHLHCLGVSRQAALHTDEFRSVLDCVCEDCKGLTVIDTFRHLRRLDEKLEWGQTRIDELIKKMNMIIPFINTKVNAMDTMISKQERMHDDITLIRGNCEAAKSDIGAMKDDLRVVRDEMRPDIDKSIDQFRQQASKKFEELPKIITNACTTGRDEINAATATLKDSITTALKNDIDQFKAHFSTDFKDRVTKIVDETFLPVQSCVRKIHDELDSATARIISLNPFDGPTSSMTVERSNASLLEELLKVPEVDSNDEPQSDTTTESVCHEGSNINMPHDEPGRYVRAANTKSSQHDIVTGLKSSSKRTGLLPNPFAISTMKKKIDEVVAKRRSAEVVLKKQNISGRVIKSKISSRSGKWVIQPANNPPHMKSAKLRQPQNGPFKKGLTKQTTAGKVNDRMKVQVVKKPSIGHSDVQISGNQHHGYATHSSDYGSTATVNYIYVTGFANDVTASDVRRFAQRKLFRDHITCRLLLRRGLHPSTKDILSFKLGVPCSVTQIALDQSFWPSGISARNFHDRRQEWNTRSLPQRH